MRMPDGATIPLKVRSLVGLLPLCAATVFDADAARAPAGADRARAGVHRALLRRRARRSPTCPGRAPRGGGCSRSSTRRSCGRSSRVMLDEDEFLGPHGIRAISRRHLEQPCRFEWGGQRYEVRYLPAESDTGMFGGNSNWRGPVWFPMNLVILRALLQLHRYYGDRLQGRVPDRLGPRAEPARGGAGDRRAADAHLHRGRAGAPAGVRRASRSSRPTRTGTTCCCSTSTSTATTAPASAPATRPAGPGRSRCCSCAARRRPGSRRRR